MTAAEIRVRRVTRGILAAGFAAAAAAYAFAVARPANPLADQLESKKYLHDLEMYGGKANVLAAQFRDWFAGLWSGTNLAWTIAALTILTALVYRFFAAPLEDADLDDAEAAAPPPRPWPPAR
jgi:hypothetical protein